MGGARLILFLFIMHSASAEFGAATSLVCGSDDCPLTAGAWIARADKAEEPEFCSFQMVEANLAITAYHCLPKDIRFHGANCASDVALYLPQTDDLEQEQLHCDHVEAFTTTPPTEGNHDVPDWALVRTRESTSRPIPRLRTTPLKPEDHVRIYAVEWSTFGSYGEIKKVDCEGKNLGYFYPLTFHEEAPLYFGRKCSGNLQNGNSGAGFYDDDGHLAGVVTAIVDGQLASSQDVVSNAFFGTKLQCVPNLNRNVSPLCLLDNQDPGLESVTVALSMLENISADPIFSSPKMDWSPTSTDNVSAYFEILFPDFHIGAGEKFLVDHHLTSVAKLLHERMRKVLPEAPACARSAGSTDLPVPVIAVGNPDVYPDAELRPYLNVDADHNFLARVKALLLPAEIAEDGDRYWLSTGAPSALNFTDAEKKNLLACQEQQAAEPRPTPECRVLFEKLTWKSAVSPFRISLPRCAGVPLEGSVLAQDQKEP